MEELNNVLTNDIHPRTITVDHRKGHSMATKSANVLARVEPEVKSKAEAVLTRLGVPVSVVINALYHQIIYTQSIPFSLSLPSKVPSLDSMSKEEFDATLESSLSQIEKGEGEPLEDVMKRLKAGLK